MPTTFREGDTLVSPVVVAQTHSKGAPVQDPEVARSSGLKAPVVPNVFHFARITELMLEHFGAHWRTHGEIDVRYISPLHAGDTLQARARVLKVAPDPEGDRVHLDVRCENQDGAVLAQGAASCVLPSARGAASGTGAG
ncbi:MAG: MaoC family dehydratase [Dehalococcoidia bacterium]|nr:MaoC family dehydratase [Dehalococcoidia bacterium]